MLDLNSIDSRENFKTLLATRAIKDANYRQSLLNNPKAILERELGPEMASRVELVSHQEVPDSLTYIINYNPKVPQDSASIRINPGDPMEAVLVKKAWKDPQYRRELLADPRSKLAQEVGAEVPRNFSFNVFEESREKMHLRIPVEALQVQAEAEQDAELTDEELENVAGGTWNSFLNWLNGADQKFGPSQGYASGVRG